MVAHGARDEAVRGGEEVEGGELSGETGTAGKNDGME
jgi:hypothetical protein